MSHGRGRIGMLISDGWRFPSVWTNCRGRAGCQIGRLVSNPSVIMFTNLVKYTSYSPWPSEGRKSCPHPNARTVFLSIERPAKPSGEVKTTRESFRHLQPVYGRMVHNRPFMGDPLPRSLTRGLPT